MPSISLIAFSTESTSSSSDSAIVTISALSPNAIGSSLASLNTPESKDSIFDLICSFSFFKSVSKFSGITLNWIAAVVILVSRCWGFVYFHGPWCSHFGHLYSIERFRHRLHLRISFVHFGHGNLTFLDVSLLQLIHFVFIFSCLGFGL